MPDQLWIVGQYRSGECPLVAWDFQGVFDSEEKAAAACKHENWFVAPVTLNEEATEEATVFSDAYYPLSTSPRETADV